MSDRGSQGAAAGKWHRDRWIAVVCVVSLLGLPAAIVSYDAYEHRQSALAAHETEIRATSVAAAEYVASVFEAVDLRMREGVAAYAEWRSEAAPTAASGHRRLAAIQRGSSHLEAIGWMDAKGDLVASSIAAERPALDIADESHFRIHRDNPDIGLFISIPRHSRRMGKVVINLSRRIEGPDGRFAGVVIGESDLSGIADVLGRIRPNARHALTVRTRDGRTLVVLPPEGGPSLDPWTATAGIGHDLVVEVTGDRVLALRTWRSNLRVSAALFGFLVLVAAGGAFGIVRLVGRLRAREASHADGERIADFGTWDKTIADGKLYWSDHLYRIYGLDPRAFGPTYSAFLDRVHPEDRPAVAEAIRSAIEEGRPYRMDHRIVRPDGGVRTVRETGELVRDVAGRVVHFRGVVQDVTELHAAALALRASEGRLAGILRISPEAIVAVDESQRIRLFSAGAERIFGYTAVEVVGEPVEMLMPERHRATHRAHLTAFGAGEDESRLMSRRGEITGLRRDGTEFPAEASIAKSDFEGEILFTAILRDVTERKSVEEAMVAAKADAEVANRAKSEFLANMSHELRTPLNAIIGFADIIERQLVGPIGTERYAEYGRDIVRAGRHLLDIINDVLDLSRIESGRMALYEDETTPAEIVDACIRIVHERVGAGDIELVRTVPADLPRLWADERKMRQIFINLLSNAVKFTPAGGRIEIAAALTADGGMEFRVADTGIGMEPKDIEKALERFSQLDGTITRSHEGTGLGLPLSKSLCELHGGTLAIESTLGKGTTVIVRLSADRVLRTA